MNQEYAYVLVPLFVSDNVFIGIGAGLRLKTTSLGPFESLQQTIAAM